MATRTWTGAARNIAQVATSSGTWATGTYTYTINGKDVSYVATSSGAANVIPGIAAAIEAAAIPEFSELTLTQDTVGGTLTFTAATAGKPFVMTTSGPAGFTHTATTASTGAEYFDNADNWAEGAVPITGDDIVFADSAISCRYALDQTGVDPDSCTVRATFTGEIGLPPTNTSNYPEYRDRYLKFGGGAAITLTVGGGQGNQSSLILIDTNGADTTLQLYGSGSAQNTPYPFNLKGTGAGSDLSCYGGSGLFESCTADNFFATPFEAGGDVYELDSNCSIATLRSTSAANVRLYGAITTLLEALGGSQVTTFGAAAAPTVRTATGGRILWASTGGISTHLYCEHQGFISFNEDASAKTVANATMYAGSELLDPLGVVTFTNPINLTGCSLADVTLDVGRNRTLAIA